MNSKTSARISHLWRAAAISAVIGSTAPLVSCGGIERDGCARARGTSSTCARARATSSATPAPTPAPTPPPAPTPAPPPATDAGAAPAPTPAPTRHRRPRHLRPPTPPPNPPDLTGAIPADANIKGMWSAVLNWPLIPIHVVLMRNGRFAELRHECRRPANSLLHLRHLEPAGRSGQCHMTLPNGTGTDIFCGFAARAAEQRRHGARRRRSFGMALQRSITAITTACCSAVQATACSRGNDMNARAGIRDDHAGQRRDVHPGRSGRQSHRRGSAGNSRHRRHVSACCRTSTRPHGTGTTRATGSHRMVASSATSRSVACGTSIPLATAQPQRLGAWRRKIAAWMRVRRCSRPARFCISVANRTARS